MVISRRKLTHKAFSDQSLSNSAETKLLAYTTQARSYSQSLCCAKNRLAFSMYNYTKQKARRLQTERCLLAHASLTAETTQVADEVIVANWQQCSKFIHNII